MIAGAWGVPLLMASGDDKACLEADQLVPGIVQAVVKQAISRFSALHMQPNAAAKKIRACAQQATSLIGTIAPYRIQPAGEEIVVHIELSTTDLAEQTLRCYSPSTCISKLIDPRTIEHRADDIRKIFP